MITSGFDILISAVLWIRLTSLLAAFLFPLEAFPWIWVRPTPATNPGCVQSELKKKAWKCRLLTVSWQCVHAAQGAAKAPKSTGKQHIPIMWK